MTLDTPDRRLLNLLQTRLPLDLHPFRVLAEMAGLPLEELLERLKRMKAIGIIRRISAIFDSHRLGYQSTLVAARVPPERLAEVSAVINAHPGVSHNYARNDAYNLWFTLAVSPESGLGLQRTVEALAHLARLDSILVLPTLRRFKIGVRLDMTEGDDGGFARADTEDSLPVGPAIPPESLSEPDKEAVRILQRDLPLVQAPFRLLSENTPFDEQALMERARALLQRGVLRRFAAILHHRRAGFDANGMGVWKVPEEQIEEVGFQMARYPAVSHCYQRPTYPDWPYNLFSMVHGKSRDACEAVFRQLSEETGLREYRVLFSTDEFKKSRVRYFTSEEAEWENVLLKCALPGTSGAGGKASK